MEALGRMKPHIRLMRAKAKAEKALEISRLGVMWTDIMPAT